MSIERVANLVETAAYRLPYVETLYNQACMAADKRREEVDYLENRKHTLKEEKSRMVTLPSSSYHYVNDRETFNSSSQSASLPYWSSENYDPWSEYRKNKRTQIE